MCVIYCTTIITHNTSYVELSNRSQELQIKSSQSELIATLSSRLLSSQKSNLELERTVQELRLKLHRTEQELECQREQVEVVGSLQEVLDEREEEIGRLSSALHKLSEESAVWQSSWDALKRENEKLQQQLMSQSNTEDSNSNSNAESSNAILHSGACSGGMRFSGVLKLPPNGRRKWYQAELDLFESRLSDPELDSHYEYLAITDIPWPISPCTPLNCGVTATMISSFLMSDLKTDGAREFGRELVKRFSVERFRNLASKITQRDRKRVMLRVEQVQSCLNKYLAQLE